MKLITETSGNIKIISEAKKLGNDYFISGIFMQSDVKNKNGRLYPDKILEREMKRYNNEYIRENRALGELGHPESPSINLERISHIIKELRKEGNDYIGTAKILDTPYGKIVKNLIDEGAKLGVSTRGMGTVSESNGTNIVNEDFYLSTVDIVADPSAPNAFVNGIVEGKEWIFENGIWKESDVLNAKKTILRTPSSKLEEQKLNIFKQFLEDLSKSQK